MGDDGRRRQRSDSDRYDKRVLSLLERDSVCVLLAHRRKRAIYAGTRTRSMNKKEEEAEETRVREKIEEWLREEDEKRPKGTKEFSSFSSSHHYLF